MKALLFSLLLFIGMVGKSQHSYEPNSFDFSSDLDTTKFQINRLPEIYRSIFEVFSTGTIPALIVHADSTMDFINAMDSTNIVGVCLASTDALGSIQKLLSGFTPCCFKMSHKELPTGADLIVVRVYVFPDKESYGVTIFFEVKHKSKITTVAIQ